MAEENKNENDAKKGGLVKYILFGLGGVALLGVGLGVGIFMGGSDTDPSSEISQIIEKKENPDADEETEIAEEIVEECTEEET